ncbi:Ypq2p KNAG_0C05100 [Huiozyma naganishii CBS 8797]|uniref:Uncharacterized protein n=1 Tax=Huiozyma naganishii (strain ATCC MYA-139 / BCRC 22969 / CBS 8797 / KCTC 17520 / NBRC 10181 / NCYC 3082 / Yp74L-3) TaxID=1071383 RepID=J7S693_HUIN7|nr:hypothetical protein KNAG_0C05100 [Kazachstania naganishii CBS 8797]CCK69611.1 hypothetical protein KNAG_0C05100 [Kazachstania naganishii CBS 8797]
MSCAHSFWPVVSTVNGSISFFSSFVALFPQILETYRDKTVDGLSPLFLICWLCGDVTSLIGALMTNQLLFQVVLAVYFLFNDMVVCGQYYYYGVVHDNTLATIGHEPVPVLSRVSRGSNLSYHSIEEALERERAGERDTIGSDHSGQRGTPGRSGKSPALAFTLALASRINASNAMPVLLLSASASASRPPMVPPPPNQGHLNDEIGITLSWLGACFYVGARVPQLIKNYRRKSTDGISPFLFATTLLGNITYNVSIFTSCNFINATDKWGFVWNAMPFIFGSAGTIAFDLVYFYQYYVLYADDYKLRNLERDYLSCASTDTHPDESSSLLAEGHAE